MRCLEAAVVGVLLALIAGSSAAQAGAVPGIGAAAGVVVATGIALRFLRNRFRSWQYQEREEDLVVKRGVAFRRLSVVPYGRMQFVDVTAGPIERLFKLSTIKLHTAAAASDARIPGLEPEEAARLRDQLASLGEAKAAGL
ncbi:MAG TPA: PH domain-containing protein [Acidimicrobiales bacterium]|nr:PH domain-containing protein [Acidimicrobiales bacterium]